MYFPPMEGTSLGKLFENNRKWSAQQRLEDPEFFTNLARAQVPEFLWIGCSDSRVPANEIIGLRAGEVFVHRNVGNVVSLTDFNCLSVVQYAVQVLKVGHITITGHYGCGGVATAIGGKDLGIVNNWLSPISDLYAYHRRSLEALPSQTAQIDKLCELNVIMQVRNLSRSAMIRDAWHQGQKLAIHGLIFGLEDGIIHDLDTTIEHEEEAEKICNNSLDRIISINGRVVD